MTLTIQLPDTLEQRIRREAEKRGLGPEDYVQQMIVSHLFPSPDGPTALDDLDPTADERLRAFEAYLAGLDRSGPPLPPEAYERESFYGERG